MGWVHAVQKGKRKDVPKKIKDIAKSIEKKDAEEFASTKHKGLPEKIKKQKKKKKRKKKVKKSELIMDLTKLANRLDDLGMVKDADVIDKVLMKLSQQTNQYGTQMIGGGGRAIVDTKKSPHGWQELRREKDVDGREWVKWYRGSGDMATLPVGIRPDSPEAASYMKPKEPSMLERGLGYAGEQLRKMWEDKTETVGREVDALQAMTATGPYAGKALHERVRPK